MLESVAWKWGSRGDEVQGDVGVPVAVIGALFHWASFRNPAPLIIQWGWHQQQAHPNELQ